MYISLGTLVQTLLLNWLALRRGFTITSVTVLSDIGNYAGLPSRVSMVLVLAWTCRGPNPPSCWPRGHGWLKKGDPRPVPGSINLYSQTSAESTKAPPGGAVPLPRRCVGLWRPVLRAVELGVPWWLRGRDALETKSQVPSLSHIMGSPTTPLSTRPVVPPLVALMSAK